MVCEGEWCARVNGVCVCVRERERRGMRVVMIEVHYQPE